MNKAQLIDAVAEETELSKAASKKAIDSVFNSISKALQSSDRVALVGFGSFSISERSARTGRNPQTGAPIEIKAKKVIKFKAGTELNEGVN